MKKPIVFFDLETTGINVQTDRIIEISMIKENPDGTQEEFYSKFNPYPIEVSEEAQRVHGMSTMDLINEPEFSEKLNEIISFIEDCDLGGYNIISFDIPLLFEEMARCGKIYNFKKHTIFDSYKIWMASEPRTLTGAAKRFLNESHENAHSAKFDVDVTLRIFKKQVEEYSNQFDSLEDMAKISANMEKRLDFSGKFEKLESGQVIITFGKHKGKTIEQVFNEDSNYFKWIYEKTDFPTDTKLISKNIYEKLQNSRIN